MVNMGPMGTEAHYAHRRARSRLWARVYTSVYEAMRTGFAPYDIGARGVAEQAADVALYNFDKQPEASGLAEVAW